MSDATTRVCDHCGAPLRGLVDGYCPYCRTRPFTADGSPVTAANAHSVLLLDAGRSKITVIKELRTIVDREFGADLGLAEAKDLVDRADRANPPALLVGVDADRAQRWAETFTRIGATVAVDPPLDARSAESAPPSAAPAPGPATASTGFGLYLTVVGRKKINVIKAVRGVTGLGLAEAKDLVDAADLQPQLVVTVADQAQAIALAQQLGDAGATAEVRTV